MWIGPPEGARAVRAVLDTQCAVLREFEDADKALAAPEATTASLAIVAADWDKAVATIQKLRASNPEMAVVTATPNGLPDRVGLALRAGASDVLDTCAAKPETIAEQIDNALARHGRAAQARELLLRLRDLNEKFLTSFVSLEEHNVALELLLLPESESVPKTDPTSYRILLIDDEPGVCHVFALAFEGTFFELTTVANGEDALKVFSQQQFPLVIADKNLPGINGLEIARRIRALSPDTDVMIITAYASKDSAIDALNDGICAYLEKPFDNVDQVIHRVEAIVARQRQRLKRRNLLAAIKNKNRSFFDQYRQVRDGIDAWLLGR